MRKNITIILSIFLLLTFVGCTTDPELKELRDQTKELKQQLSVVPSPRPLKLRQELLNELQDEFSNLKPYIPQIKANVKDNADKIADIEENVNKQTEIMNGIDGEEGFETLSNKVFDLKEKYETYLNNGSEKQAQEIEKQINLILYGNENGDKTW